MRFDRSQLFYQCIATLFVLGLAENVFADQEEKLLFNLKPSKCIALHKGQDCYQKIKFHWRTPVKGKYCIFSDAQSNPIACWHGEGDPPFVYEFVGKRTQRFLLRDDNQLVIQEAEFIVTWVYTSSKRDSGGWRLF